MSNYAVNALNEAADKWWQKSIMRRVLIEAGDTPEEADERGKEIKRNLSYAFVEGLLKLTGK